MKTKRQIIKIDEKKCNGCGFCVNGCHEGALQVIDGKARLISDLLCDGLGACIGECPQGAIKIATRLAEPYDEAKVMAIMAGHGSNTIKAHLKHLRDHGQKNFLAQALDYMKQHGIELPGEAVPCGCPGGRTMDFLAASGEEACAAQASPSASQLRQWPVQLHLASPMAPYFHKADLVVAADCTAFAYGNFHNGFMKDKALVIACPKLDDGHELYVEKFQALIEDAKVNTITVVMMEVPCCGGLLALVKKALETSKRKVLVKQVVISLRGAILSEDWV